MLHTVLLVHAALAGMDATGKGMLFTGNPTAGACGYNSLATDTFPYGYYAATGSKVFKAGYGCGRCYEVTCKGPADTSSNCSCSTTTPSVVVQARDECPTCSCTEFGLSPTALARIAESETCGDIEIEFKRVDCGYKSSIRVWSVGGTNDSWYGLNVDEVAGYGSLSGVSLKNADGSVAAECDKNSGAAYWACAAATSLVPPLTVTLKDCGGRLLNLDGLITDLTPYKVYATNTNYPAMPVPKPDAPPATDAPVPPSLLDESASGHSPLSVVTLMGVAAVCAMLL